MTSQNTVLYTPFAGGRTVRDIVEHSPALVSEAWCRQILQHILQSLEQQYASHAPHRIITPDTVAVLESGEALLLPSPDGLASDEADSAQDIHALALVIHYAISAEVPPEGPLGPRLYDNYSDALTRTVDRCLGPNLRLRPKNIPELRAMLGMDDAAAPLAVPAVPAKEPVAPAAAQVEETPLSVPAPAAQAVPLDTPFELSTAEAPDPVEPARVPARQSAPDAAAGMPSRMPSRMPAETQSGIPAGMPSPAPAREATPDKPIAATPLKPSAHAAPVAASATAPAMAPAAPARPPVRTPPQPARKKSSVERWAMIAGAAIVLLAAGSALYAHLNQDHSDDTLALSVQQETAAQGLDAGEAVVVAPAGSAGATPSGNSLAEAEPAIGTTDADAAPGALPDAGNTAAPLHNTTAPAARQADAVVNGTTYKLLIKPWGTVYVNDVDRGVSPPVKRLTLGQGQHTIRIVNPNFAEHVMTVNAGTAESATIEHDFTAQADGGR